MAQPVQNLANHGRYVPLYHGLLAVILGANLFFAVKRAWREPNTEAFMGLALAIGFMIFFWYARAFALRVQDRVIRLEMRLRLERLLPAPQFARFGQLSPSQLVALRFAGDQELPGLVADVLEGRLAGAGDIKGRIKDWQADWLRV